MTFDGFGRRLAEGFRFDAYWQTKIPFARMPSVPSHRAVLLAPKPDGLGESDGETLIGKSTLGWQPHEPSRPKDPTVWLSGPSEYRHLRALVAADPDGWRRRTCSSPMPEAYGACGARLRPIHPVMVTIDSTHGDAVVAVAGRLTSRLPLGRFVRSRQVRVLTTRQSASIRLKVMGIKRTAIAIGLLVVAAGIAALGVLVHHGIVTEYGDIADSTLEAWRSGLAIGAIAFVLAGIPAVGAAEVVPRVWTRLVAAGLLVLIPLGMLAVTPAAQRSKFEQYDAIPQCVSRGDVGPGPGTRAQRRSQRAFESIEHVGYFGGGGGSGLGGCDRTFTLTKDVNVLEHYRAALPATGWQVVEDEADHLRAERNGMAFEVAVCGREGVVWAGDARIRGIARCHRNRDIVTVP